MLTLRDHIGGDPVLRLGSPAKPLAEREKDARKRQQQDEALMQMAKVFASGVERKMFSRDHAGDAVRYMPPETLPPGPVVRREMFSREELSKVYDPGYVDDHAADLIISYDHDDGA